MRSFGLKKLLAVSALGLAVVAAGAGEANAQGRNVYKQQEKVAKQQAKVEQQRLKLEQERLRMERERLRTQQARNNRWRVNRGGRWYNVDQRQSQMLQQAINEGYRQGFSAARADRSSRRGSNWGNSSIYRSGTFGYQSYVDRNLYQHYFQQGFQRGYEDGYNSRQRYGSFNGGSASMFGNILQQILGLQQF
jgi:hypothetical protein